MSYCRFSSNNFMCDVYVYEDVNGGWTTHVASNRMLIPPIPSILGSALLSRFSIWTEATYDMQTRTMHYPKVWKRRVADAVWPVVMFWHNQLHKRSLRYIPLRPIKLPYDGQSFNDLTPGACADRLVLLQELGYVVPQAVINTLYEENEGAPSQTP